MAGWQVVTFRLDIQEPLTKHGPCRQRNTGNTAKEREREREREYNSITIDRAIECRGENDTTSTRGSAHEVGVPRKIEHLVVAYLSIASGQTIRLDNDDGGQATQRGSSAPFSTARRGCL